MTAPALAQISRRIAVIPDDEPLRCPVGHPIPRDTWTPGTAAVRCKHRSPHLPSSQCGLIVLVVAFTEGLRVLAEVTHVEAAHIEAHRMLPRDIPRYLGLGWVLEHRRN